MERFINELASLQVESMLDIATGTGHFIKTIEKYVPNKLVYTGIDINSEVLDRAAEEIKNYTNLESRVKLINADFTAGCFNQNEFDLVSISNSLHHFRSLNDCFSEIRRVLKNEGRFIINEMISDENQSIQELNHVKLHHWYANLDRSKGCYHRETYRKNELEDLVRSNLGNEFTSEIYSPGLDVVNMKSFTDRIIDSMNQTIAKLDKKKNSLEIETGIMIRQEIEENGITFPKSIFILGKKCG
ncbi:MAG: methyltransferase domain-containing protein [Candidatus Delongbacteria bacterium]|nr:methyltransferase domain-containing protein [Candidatus Delongbacteria bacterium]MBN2836722.1 methyltransferase domain-containing protein [Candidatus Delongbacteria bacterium]